MSDLKQAAHSSTENGGGANLFAELQPEPPRRSFLFGAAAAAFLVAAIASVALIQGHHTGGPEAMHANLPADAYASNLMFTQLAMSQSTSLSGGTSTFLDGHVRNSGNEAVTGMTVQVVFSNDMSLSPQVETMPLYRVRTHQPYVDTEPLNAAPLTPGDEIEFRLISENIPSNWNRQMPQLTVVHVQDK